MNLVEKPSRQGGSEERSGHRILVVDDSSFFRRLLSDTLSEAGHEVVLAADGLEALELVERDRPDLLVSDLVMPRMNGFELLEKIRQRLDSTELPVLVVTEVLASDEEIEKLRELGCDGYVNKFAPPDHVVFRVEAALYPADSDARRHRRVAISLPVQYRVNRTSGFAYTYTLSRDGMFIRCSDPPERGTQVELSFSLGSRARNLRPCGEVVHRQQRSAEGSSPSGFGVRFTDLEADDEAEIEQFIEDTLRSGI